MGLAIENPGVFGRFVDVGGDLAPNHGAPAATLRYLYGGDPQAARRFDPDQILDGHRFGHIEGWFAAGTGDRSGLRAAHRLAGLAGRAGIVVHAYQGPGGHTWAFARHSFERIYPALVNRLSGESPIPGNPVGAGARTRSGT
jgi:S-formylglutathione hydrolase FrmB